MATTCQTPYEFAVSDELMWSEGEAEAKLNLWTGIYWAIIQRAMYCDRACVIEVEFVCTEGAAEELARHESDSIVFDDKVMKSHSRYCLVDELNNV